MRSNLPILFLVAFIISPMIRLTAQVENYKKFMHFSYSELDSLVSIEYNKGAFNKVIPYIEAGREKAKVEFGEQDSVFAEYTDNLAFFYNTLGQSKEAESLYLQVMAIRKKTLGEQHPNYATSLNNLAYLYKSMGNYAKAEPLYLQGIAIEKKVLGEQHPDYATSLNNLALLYDRMGNYAKAESLFLQAMAIWKKALGDQHPDYAISLNNLAYLYYNMGNYAQTEPLFLQAMAIYKKALGEQHPNYAASLNNLAYLYKSMENYEKAEPLFLQAMAIEKKALGDQHPNYAMNLNNLAFLYYNMKNYAKAEPLYLQAIAIRKKTLGDQHPEYASSLNNLAYLYRSIGNYAKAEPLFLQATAIWKKYTGKQYFEYSNSLNNLAGLYESMGKLDTAFYYCRLGILTKVPNMDSSFSDWGNLDTFTYTSDNINISIKTLLSILHKQYEQTKDKSKLETYYALSQAAIRLNERFRNKFTAEGDKLRVLSKNNGFVLAAIKTGMELKQPGYEAQTFGFAEMNKGILLLESAKTANAQQFGGLPDTIAEQEKNLQKKQSSLSAKLLEKRSENEKDSLRKILNTVNLEIDDFTKMLKGKYPKYVALKYGNKTASAKEIQALLDDKTALLEYIIGDSVVYAFYLDKKQVKLSPIYLSNNILNEKIKTLHSVLSDYNLAIKEPSVSYQKYTENAFWFYKNLVAPALNHAKGISKLLIVSDGELGHLPFEAFLTKAAPQQLTDYRELAYLSNDYKISYNYSATIWKTAKETSKNKNNGQILGMASNYEIKMDTSVNAAQRSTKIDWRLPYEQRLREGLGILPAARREIEILSGSFNGYFAFDKDASEKNFKAKAGDYAIIHLAMHGLLDNKNQILSSLAFTEDGDSLENNFLHAYEISKMKLNADLVVLSACETGYGRFEKGNGIASLAQAFAYAGAPALIVSLWQVNDYATSEIMKNLYQNLANGMEKDEALQQAKIEYIKEAKDVLAHPAFWSPFILMGNTDAITLERTHVFTSVWVIGIALFLLAGIVFFVFKMKK